VVTGSPAFAGDDDREGRDRTKNHHGLVHRRRSHPLTPDTIADGWEPPSPNPAALRFTSHNLSHRQNGVASANSANGLVAAAIATSRRAFSRPPSNPAAKARLASHSSRSNSREVALALIVWI
jgi:hypothetical protein